LYESTLHNEYLQKPCKQIKLFHNKFNFKWLYRICTGNTCNDSSQNILNCGEKYTLKCEKNYPIVLPQPNLYPDELTFQRTKDENLRYYDSSRKKKNGTSRSGTPDRDKL